MSREEARRRTDEFKAHTEVWLEELAALYIEQVWYALDYETFDQYCHAELGSIRLPRAGRTEAVLTLRDAGLSIRAISSALGLGVGTVHREIEAGVPTGTPDPPNGPQKETIGRDGKHYPASSPTPDPAPEPEVVEAEVVEAEPEPPPPEPKKKEAAEPQPPPPDVTQPEPERPYHRPIDALVDELGVIVAQLERHVESEDFTDLRNRRRYWFTTGASGVIESLSRRLADVTTHLSSAQRTRAEWARLTSAEKCRWGRAYDEGADPVEVMKEVIVWRRVDDNQYVPVRVDTLANDDLYQEWKRERSETKARKRRS